MRNIFGLRIETKVSLAIVLMCVIIFLFAIFRSINNFNKFSNRIGDYEKLRIEEGVEK